MTSADERTDVLAGFGMSVRLPDSWEGRIFLRQPPEAGSVPTAGDQRGVRGPAGGAYVREGERVTPVMHLANFGLPAGRGDFGSGAVELMGPRHAFVALLEFGPDELGSALFSEQGMPRPAPEDFQPACLQRRLAGQLGYQRFFTLGDRPMCLYVVVGSRGELPALCAGVNLALAAVELS